MPAAGGILTCLHSSHPKTWQTPDNSEPWATSALLNTPWLGSRTGEIWPRPRVCYRRNNAPCTKANLNVSLHTVVLGMKQETDLFEQSSISICNHTPVCCDPINSHKPRDSGRSSSAQSKSMVPNTPWKTTTYFKVEGRKSDLLPTKSRAEENSASINRRQSGMADKSMSSGARWTGFSSRVCCFLACDLGQII